MVVITRRALRAAVDVVVWPLDGGAVEVPAGDAAAAGRPVGAGTRGCAAALGTRVVLARAATARREPPALVGAVDPPEPRAVVDAIDLARVLDLAVGVA